MEHQCLHRRTTRGVVDGYQDGGQINARVVMHRTAKSLHDRLQDIPSGFGGYDSVSRLEREVSGQLDKAQKALDRLKNKVDDELIAAVESRAAKRLKEMSAQELEQFEKSIPPADEEPRA
jgi:hypothetical protein